MVAKSILIVVDLENEDVQCKLFKNEDVISQNGTTERGVKNPIAECEKYRKGVEEHFPNSQFTIVANKEAQDIYKNNL